MDHVDAEMNAFNAEMQSEDKRRTTEAERNLGWLTRIAQWTRFLQSWKEFYVAARPGDILSADELIWQMTGAYEDDLYRWRFFYQQVTGQAPKSRYVLYTRVLQKEEEPYEVNIGPPRPVLAGFLTVLAATAYIWFMTKGGGKAALAKLGATRGL